MLRQTACIVLFMALAPPAYAQSAAATEPPKMEPESREARLTALVAKAEREARAGRLPEAVFAYSDAFDLGRDPRVGGRLGVLLVQLDNAVVAADLLMNALERAPNAPAHERLEFFKAYDVARSRVCRLEVTVTEPHAKILIDGRVSQQDGITGFAMFVPPGEHELRAKLPGFRDAAVHIVAVKGATLEVELKLEPDAPSLPPSPAVALRPSLREALPLLPSTNIATDPNYSSKEDPFYEQPKAVKPIEKRGVRFSVSGGVVTVFGVASWNPALGGVLGARLSPNEYVSFSLEGRAAWLTSGVGGERISAMTAGGLLSACGHLKWFFGCALPGDFRKARVTKWSTSTRCLLRRRGARYRDFALSGLGRVDFAVGPPFPDRNESTDGLAIFVPELHVFASERADFIGAKVGVRHEREDEPVRFDCVVDDPIDLFVARNFENALTDRFEPWQVWRSVTDVFAGRRESQDRSKNDPRTNLSGTR